MTEERVLPPPPPPSSTALLRHPSTETDFWAGLFLDLTVRIEWLEQALDVLPREGPSAAAQARLRGYHRALEELRGALDRVQSHRADPRFRPLFALEGELAALLSRLYGWCEEISDDFERMAVALRKKAPTSVVFSHQAVNGWYAHFDELTSRVRHSLEVARDLHGARIPDAWRAFEEHVEELVWATEWLHMALARPPGA